LGKDRLCDVYPSRVDAQSGMAGRTRLVGSDLQQHFFHDVRVDRTSGAGVRGIGLGHLYGEHYSPARGDEPGKPGSGDKPIRTASGPVAYDPPPWLAGNGVEELMIC